MVGSPVRGDRLLAKGTLLVVLWLFILSVAGASALTREDILIVYNRNMPESEQVATYYATRRDVPRTNLVGITAPLSERMVRPDFEREIVPKIRNAVVELRKAGRTPAILLVYGIPLSVRDTLDTQRDQETFRELTKEKDAEIARLVETFSRRLRDLIGPDVSKRKPGPLGSEDLPGRTALLQATGRLIAKAVKRLADQDAAPLEPERKLKVASILFRLTGMSPIAEGVRRAHAENGEGLLLSSLGDDSLIKWSAILGRELGEIPFRGVTLENAEDLASAIRLHSGLIGELQFWSQQNEIDISERTSASVESELALIVARPYLTASWLPNPFLERFDGISGITYIRKRTIMVGRLDGPTPEAAKRLVDDAIDAEASGLSGVFYIDASGKAADDSSDAYVFFDERLRKLHELVKERSTIPVVLDDRPELFSEGCCPDAALYCGWYSLGKYVDAFKWRKGAVGYHIASAEATTLKQEGSQVWCKRMIEEGVAATLGPVEEPYLESFPLPDRFFPLLMAGKLPLLEVYFRSTPFLSWRQILIGDPLYTPFKKNPALDLTNAGNTE